MLIYNLDILQDILKCFKVNEVIITSLYDVNLVKKILEYDASFFVFDSNDEFNFSQVNLEAICGNSLDILPKFENYGAIFINDDSNWYTIYNELNIIKNTNDEFPLVFICNNRFPNKRRDSYFDPNLIPDDFKHEYIKEFPICYDDKRISVSDGCYHACEENTDKNGVLTAIEDFLSENRNIGIMDIHFTEEITVLYPKSSINQIRLGALNECIKGNELDDINFSDKNIEKEFLFNFIHEFNNLQNDSETIESLKSEISQKNELINVYENKLQIHDSELDYKEGQLNNIKSKLSLKDSQIDNYKSKLFNNEYLIDNLQSKIKSANKQIEHLKNEITTKESYLNNKINDFKVKETQFKNQIEDAQNQINDNIVQLKDTKLEISDKENQIKAYQKEISDSNHEIEIKNKVLSDKEDQIKYYQKEISDSNQEIKIKNKELFDKENELKIEKQNNISLKNQQINTLNEIESNKYCISCFKEEISNNKSEIQYLKSEGLTKKIMSFSSYLVLIMKSNPKELSINLKLYKLLKNSQCFDIGYYLNNNKDIQNSKWCKYFSPELHYVCFGFNEKRKFNKKYYKTLSKKELLDYILNCP